MNEEADNGEEFVDVDVTTDVIYQNSDEIDTKISRLKDVIVYLEKFDDYVNEEIWAERFDVPLPVYLEQFADPNLIIFMNMLPSSSSISNTYSPLKK